MTSALVSQMTIPTRRISRENKLALFAGYSFGWPKCLGSARPYAFGCLTTPRYAKRVAREVNIQVMLDNGAWSDFVNSRHRYLIQVVEELVEACEIIGPKSIQWVIAPDIVGRGYLSDRRAYEGTLWLNEKGVPGKKILWPVQEGMSLRNPIAFYLNGRIGGLFIGGKTRRWKFEMAAAIRRAVPDIHIHIARISSLTQLEHAVSIGADSFDTTTYSRQNNWNRRQDFGPTLDPYCKLSNEEFLNRVGYY